ncbi:endonuclease Q family protein [Lysinibacillus sp. OL1_EC]|uniref:endonuclease Q family protein n=1 Tax=unclassified Lysinibacillus TaxID=2636778 RepID=UPI00103BB6F8|nr:MULTISPECIES: endonuclease Q family protein [unclassified Lysinibacillus]MCM0626817.1 endonuclease Q family protein [Lysinibacillus sp. OL1_EC]MCS5503896.1 endonuclease Q family protein [Lysinibacillus sp. A4]TBV85328.1 TIGR00375 family protein [Lysinibacillus sp. OL1]
MNEFYADLHIHIGRTSSGRAVKITGSKTLTLARILETASARKGLDIIGIIDCHSPEVIEEMVRMIEQGELQELKEGGLRFQETTLIPGSEIEIYDQHCQGPIHVLAYFPTLELMKLFSEWMSQHMKNIHLSSQRIYCDGKTLQQKVHELGGIFIPAHVFTPFKSLFGKGVRRSLTEVFDPELIDGIELGLSSDTNMVSHIKELQAYTFVSNSDAHSLGKLAREYQKLRLAEANFTELKMALHEQEGRAVIANYGLNPLLGKYHQTVCAKCSQQLSKEATICTECGSNQIIKGVATRIQELSEDFPNKRNRPPYIHQIPLDFIPGIGPKMMERLIEAFGTEMNILHRVTIDQLEQTVPHKLAQLIDLARTGQLAIEVGGGGIYGKIQVD